MSEAVERDLEIQLTGEVRAADLDAGILALRLSDGERVEVRFPPEYGELVATALQGHTHQKLQVRALQVVDARSGQIRTTYIAEEVALVDIADAKPIWEIALELGARIPEDELDQIPTDLARNLDHYLYGAPKSNEAARSELPPQ